MRATEKSALDGVRWVRFQHVDDGTGSLTAVESGEHVPFDIARVFFVHRVEPGAERGRHAHRDTDQVLSCVAGRMKVDVSDGRAVQAFLLDDPASGLLVPRMMWTRLYDFEDDAVLAVYANTSYDPSRSIRTWEAFREAVALASDMPEPRCSGAPSLPDGKRAPERVRSSSIHSDLIRSALGDGSIRTDDDVMAWLDARRTATDFRVERKPLTELRGWRVDARTGNVVHESGKFFQVVGLDVSIEFAGRRQWRQPVISQPEIGILGMLAQRIDGQLHFLVQAKMEPGNVNLLQLSPTLQATRSNFTQVHGGRKPRYLEYFLGANPKQVLVDQLQSEQGSKFLNKRNRNMIVLAPDDASVPVHEDFAWLTLAQIHRFLRAPNLVNMDSRSVLAGIRYGVAAGCCKASGVAAATFHSAVMRSILADDRCAVHTTDAVVAWFIGMKAQCHAHARVINLHDAAGWTNDGNVIRHESGRFFSVVGVSVSASTREVTAWDQPLIESTVGALCCFICQSFGGVLHFLVNVRAEAGTSDGVELAPSLQYTPLNYSGIPPEELPHFAALFEGLRPDQVRYDSLQSEEGGRFFHDETRYVIAETDLGQIEDIPPDYCWATLNQLQRLIRFNNCLNVEARSLLACLGLARQSTVS